VWAVVLAQCAGNSSSPSNPCPVGSEGCSCTGGGVCDPGLACYSNLCVRPTPGTGNDAGRGGTAGTGGWIGTGGVTTAGGVTGTGGSSSACPPPAGTPFSVGKGGLVTSGSWHGYAWTSTWGTGATIAPADFSAVAAGGELCVSGSVPGTSDSSAGAILGINLKECTPRVQETWTPTGSGLSYDLTNVGGSPLRIQILAQGGDTDASKRWCVNVTAASGTIKWTEFNTTCWNNAGIAYDGVTPLWQLHVEVPGGTTAVSYNFCLNSIGPASANGGTGGTAGGGGGTTAGTGGAPTGGAAGGSSAGASGSTVASGDPGSTCTTDADCKSGRCVDSALIPDVNKACSTTCNTTADCQTFWTNGKGFNFVLPANLQGSNNAWDTSTLIRGIACTRVGPPQATLDDGKTYCNFGCPANSAIGYDSSGNPAFCRCLPNFSIVAGTASGVMNCQWDSTVECSIFKPCSTTATGTGPCAQNVSCYVSSSLVGICFSRTNNIEACVESTGTSCDGACLANNCVGTLSGVGNDPCVDMCCK